MSDQLGDEVSQTRADVKKWRRRERSMLGGLLLWALAVGAVLTYAPEQAGEWITTRPPLAVGGTTLMGVGLLSGLVETIWRAVANWIEPSQCGCYP